MSNKMGALQRDPSGYFVISYDITTMREQPLPVTPDGYSIAQEVRPVKVGPSFFVQNAVGVTMM